MHYNSTRSKTKARRYIGSMISRKTISVAMALLCASVAQAQLSRGITMLVYPLAWRLPETGYGFGIAGSASFYTKSSDSLSTPSSVQIGIGYTQKHQLQVYFPFEFFWCNRKHTLQGEVGYYDYNYNFYGVYRSEPSAPSRFDLNMALARAQYLRKVRPHFYVGARWWFERYVPVGIPSSVEGHQGSTNSSPGILFLFDSRDHIQAARKGYYLEVSANYQSQLTGSTHEFGRLRADARHYFTLKKKHTLATQLFVEQITGTAPFNQLSNVGDAKRARGFYPGYFRNNSVAIANLEWRFAFRPRLVAAAFVHTNTLGNRVSESITNAWHTAGGLGLRIVVSQEMRVHLRLDGAYSSAGFNWYLAIGEAF